MDFTQFDQRPLMIAVAGPNGAGKTSFCDAHLRDAGLRRIDADVLARELQLELYVAAQAADALRRALVLRHDSFIFETVFSDPVGDKIEFMKSAAESGYTVVLCFIGIGDSETSEQRVAMRVSQGGHDVPTEKLYSRFPRTMANLDAAIRELPHVLVFDNDDLARPFRLMAVFKQGSLVQSIAPLPSWLSFLQG